MIEIKEKQELNVVNVISYRGKVKQAELENIGKDMESYIQQAGAMRKGTPITATYAVEGDTIDIEIIIPIDKSIDSADGFVFKNQIKIVNATVMSYIGNPVGLQEACEVLNKYIVDNKLQPITVGYNITKKVDMLDMNNTEIDVYVGINPNVL